MASNDLLRKIGIYGGNFLAKPIGNLIKPGANLGNAGGAILYGVLDIFRNATPATKESKYVRLLEAAGGGVYAAKTVLNLVSLAKGDFESLIDLPFNATMAYEVVKNAIEDYRGPDKGIVRDVVGVGQDAINVVNGVKNVRSR